MVNFQLIMEEMILSERQGIFVTSAAYEVLQEKFNFSNILFVCYVLRYILMIGRSYSWSFRDGIQIKKLKACLIIH